MDEAQRDIAVRVALRLLVDTYARDVDRRDTTAVADLFTEDGRLVTHFHPGPDGLPSVRSGRAEIVSALVAGLRPYRATTHIVGGQVVTIAGDGATGETACLAHHLYERDGGPRLLVMAVRYRDTYVHAAGSWRFAERQLRLDWRHDYPMAEG